MAVSDEQPWKAARPKVSSFVPRSMVVRLSQLRKALTPMLVTLAAEKSTERRASQL